MALGRSCRLLSPIYRLARPSDIGVVVLRILEHYVVQQKLLEAARVSDGGTALVNSGPVGSLLFQVRAHRNTLSSFSS